MPDGNWRFDGPTAGGKIGLGWAAPALRVTGEALRQAAALLSADHTPLSLARKAKCTLPPGTCSPSTCFYELLYIVAVRSEEHTSELQSLRHLVCRLLLE